MRRSELFWGTLLAGGGALLLLQNFGLIGVASDLFWMVAFAAFGLAFLVGFAVDRNAWWSLIPGYVLLGLAAVIGVERFFPTVSDNASGMIFLGAIGLSFWTIYALRPRQWWAIIPGGVLLTLGIVAGMGAALPGAAAGGIFFLGLAMTFGLLYVLPTTARKQRWALVPAAILGLLSLVTFTATAQVLDYVWPAVLIGVGLFLLYRSIQPRAPRSSTPAEDSSRESTRDEPTLPQPH